LTGLATNCCALLPLALLVHGRGVHADGVNNDVGLGVVRPLQSRVRNRHNGHACSQRRKSHPKELVGAPRRAPRHSTNAPTQALGCYHPPPHTLTCGFCRGHPSDGVLKGHAPAEGSPHRTRSAGACAVKASQKEKKRGAGAEDRWWGKSRTAGGVWLLGDSL
jgi:hypothetical protein